MDEYVTDGAIVGVGSGSTVVYAAERLGELVREQKLNIKCIPTSFQSKQVHSATSCSCIMTLLTVTATNGQLIAENKLTLTSLDEHPVIDVTIDGADEVDLQLNCIKGGGGCQLQEKIVAFAAKRFVIIADYRKESIKLGEQWTQGVPIEVVPMAYVPLTNTLKGFGGSPVLRMAKSKAGPVVTDNGNFVLDVHVRLSADSFRGYGAHLRVFADSLARSRSPRRSTIASSCCLASWKSACSAAWPRRLTSAKPMARSPRDRCRVRAESQGLIIGQTVGKRFSLLCSSILLTIAMRL